MFDASFKMLNELELEIEYDGRTYLRLATIEDGLVLAIEKNAKLPAAVVVIKTLPKTEVEE